MAIQGWYYLHTNGSLIYNNDPEAIMDIRESDFCVAAWAIDHEYRSLAWSMLIEALSIGADPKRIEELAFKWDCLNEDALTFAHRVGVTLAKHKFEFTAVCQFGEYENKPRGHGNTCLDAMADLCRELGYKGSKLWGNTFKELVEIENARQVMRS